jgi:hypothetical protein
VLGRDVIVRVARGGIVDEHRLGDAVLGPARRDLAGPVEPVDLLQPMVTTEAGENECDGADNDGRGQ